MKYINTKQKVELKKMLYKHDIPYEKIAKEALNIIEIPEIDKLSCREATDVIRYVTEYLILYKSF